MAGDVTDPTADDALTAMSISELAPLVRTRQVSSLDLVRAVSARIQRVDSWLRAFITVCADEAVRAAVAADAEIAAGRYRGPLHGIPVAHKDVYETCGVRTTAHSMLFQDYVPREDAAVVAGWRDAGAIVIGKTNTYELASGREQSRYGIPRNPWHPERVTGGSSTGSGAALAAGLCYGASGTDGGGSIRAPAALCGVVGLRPTYGLVSRRGTLGSSGSTTCCGPMARTVADVALLLRPLVGPVPGDAVVSWPGGDPSLRGIRVGVARRHFLDPANVDQEVGAAVERAVAVLGAAGAEVTDVDISSAHLTDAAYDVIAHAEAAAMFGARARSRPDAFGFSTRVEVEAGGRVTAAQYLTAQQIRTVIEREFARVFGQVDLIVTPTAFRTATTPADDLASGRPHPRRPISLTGGPSISVPCGLDSGGLPIGLQLAGRPWEESTVLRAAYVVEQALPLGPYPSLTTLPDLPPLSCPTAPDSTADAVEARYARLTDRLADAAHSLSLDGVPPAVRFHVARPNPAVRT